MKKCPYCGAQIEDDSRFCTECGKKFPQGICPHCGTLVNEGDKFCLNCGGRIEEGTDYEGEVLSEYEDPRRNSLYIPIVAGLLLLAMIGGWWFFNSSNQKIETSEKVVDSVAVDSVAIDTTAVEEIVVDTAALDTASVESYIGTDNTENYQNKEESIDDITNDVDEDSDKRWYVFGTKDELEEQRIIKSNSVNPSSWNINYFTEINGNERKTINLYSNSARLISSHPSDSYELSTDNSGKYKLTIIDPHSFWSSSKYLVILVE